MSSPAKVTEAKRIAQISVLKAREKSANTALLIFNIDLGEIILVLPHYKTKTLRTIELVVSNL